MKYLATILAVSLTIANVTAQTAKATGLCLPTHTKVICDTKYGHQMWAGMSKESCEQLKSDLEAVDIACDEAKAELGQVGEKTKEADEIREQLEKVGELRKAIGELLSSDKAQQIKGVTDVGKITNSQFNTNPLSKAVVDKSLSAIDRFAQKENESLGNTLKSVQSILGPQGRPTTPYDAGGHVLNDSLRDEMRRNGYGADVVNSFERNVEKGSESVARGTSTAASGAGKSLTPVQRRPQSPEDVYTKDEMDKFRAGLEQDKKEMAKKISDENKKQRQERAAQAAFDAQWATPRSKPNKSTSGSSDCHPSGGYLCTAP
jgi:hypothetical protein